jgi:hypothetical protein
MTKGDHMFDTLTLCELDTLVLELDKACHRIVTVEGSDFGLLDRGHIYCEVAQVRDEVRWARAHQAVSI